MKKHPAFILFTLLALFSLVLSACDAAEDTGDEAYTEDVVVEETEEVIPEDAPTEEASTGAAESIPGEVIYDFGFTPEENGFSFENYGDDIPATNLTADELRRMFGDEVCADINGDECILTPPAEQWME